MSRKMTPQMMAAAMANYNSQTIALFMAISKYDTAAVKKAFADDVGGDITVNAHGPDGLTPLLMAIRLSKNFMNARNIVTRGLNMDVIKLLLDKKADPNLCSGDTGDFYSFCPPLFIAAVIDYAPLCEMLIEYGANVNATERRGYNALQSSISLKNTRVTALLIKKGINANLLTKDGFTPLHLAAYSGDLDAVEAMIELSEGRTNVLVKDGFGRSVLEHAEQSKNKSLIKYLTAAIAAAKSAGATPATGTEKPASAAAVQID